MSKPPRAKSASLVAVPPASAASPRGTEPTLEGFMGMFAPSAISEMMIEGFARAFERKFQGASMDALTDALQLAADLRMFKEGLFLTGEQVCRLLQISERTFDQYKRDGKIAVDPHIGKGSLRFSIFDVVRARLETLQEARPRKS